MIRSYRAVKCVLGALSAMCFTSTIASGQVSEFQDSSVAQASPISAGRSMVSVTIIVAIVGDNLSIKPVPLHELRLTSSNIDNIETITARTGLDGTATLMVPSDDYEVTSAQPVSVDGTQYFWTVGLDASGPAAVRLELTNANAKIAAAPTAVVAPPTQGRQMAPEREVYQKVRAGVFRIEAGLSRGSGFLMDTSGLILTNAHVVAGQRKAVAVLDSVTTVPVQILYRDEDADVAVLRAASSNVRNRPVLPLSEANPLVEAGERVLAIGYPLHQEQTVTSGIVSSLREGAVISDVNINHGNSGGPLLNLAGQVVAINTFGDTPDQRDGPGISGSVVITRAVKPLSLAIARADSAGLPDARVLPIFPRGRFRIQDLKAFADSVKPADYAKYESIGIGRFSVSVTTPPITYVIQKRLEREVGKDRKKREDRAGMNQEERFSQMRGLRDWQEYVGDERATVVAIGVQPKIGETTGSVFRRLLLTGVNGKETIRYSGDLQEAFFFRNGEPVTPLRGGTGPVIQYVDNRWVDLKDVANYGYYVLSAEVFAPDANGAAPSIVIELADFKNPTLASCRELSRDLTAAIWNDFGSYFAAADTAYTSTDPNKVALGKPTSETVCAKSRQLRGAPRVQTERPDVGTKAMGGRP
jgi:S1-C subfamily serine protease